MTGINLSQPEQKKVHPRFFDNGTLTGIALLVITLCVFGGLRWYIGSLEKQNQSLDVLLAEKKNELQGENVDRLADVNSRITHLTLNPTKDAKDILMKLEEVIIPAVALTSLRYDNESSKISLEATTNNFKDLAQQIQILKSTEIFSLVRMDEVVRTQTGDIAFSLEVQLVVSADKK